MSDKRRTLRLPPTGKVAKTGKLVFASGTPLECQVVNLSAGGACLRIPELRDLSKPFEFHHGGTRHVCQVAWQRGYTVGIRYAGSTPKSLHTSVLNKQSTLARRK